MVNGVVPYLDAGDIRDKSPAGFVAGSNDPRKTSAAERLSACSVGNQDLTAAKKRIDFASAEHRLIAIGAGHDDDLVENVILDRRVA
jgi:hypothetical protein